MKQLINNFFLTGISIVKIFLQSKWFNTIKLKSTKKSCIIIGNGPSFNSSIIENKKTIQEHELICVNNFAITDFYDDLKPKYYLLQAPILFQSNENSSPLYINMRDVLFNHIEVKTKWELNLMVPFRAKKSKEFLNLLKQNKFIKAHFFNDIAIEGFDSFIYTCYRLKLGMPRPHNVLIPTIMNAISIGFKEINIIGADHSWLGEISVNNSNEALVNQKHFYDESVSKPEKMQDYISRPRKLHEIIHKFYLTFQGYWIIEKYSKRNQTTIYNASQISMIDAFERRLLK